MSSALTRWRDQDALSKCVVAASLLLLVFAYLPTMRSDYVAPDQWRAFRYSVLPQRPTDRFKACESTAAPYYSRTGRPLVWITECIEHAAVAKIADFAFLRPLVLVIVVAISVVLGSVLAPLTGGLAIGVIAACAFLMSPGCSFMVLQGMTGASVLITIPLAAASFQLLRDRLANAIDGGRPDPARLLAPFGLFLVACLIYPAWAFVAVGLTLVAVPVDLASGAAAALKRLTACLLFYATAALAYYGFERMLEAIEQAASGFALEEPGYSMAMQSAPGVLIARVAQAIGRSYAMPPLNFDAPPAILPATLAVFAGCLAWTERKHGGGAGSKALAFWCAGFLLGGIVLLGSIAPWLFSSADRLATRHLAPWYLFFCVVAIGTMRAAARRLPARWQSLAPAFVLIAGLLPVVIAQAHLSALETTVSRIEIDSLRASLDQWLDRKGYVGQRYLLAVRPQVPRPALAQSVGAGAGDGAILSSAANWVQISWMVTALLRERSDHPLGRSVRLVDCVLDQACVEQALRDPHTVAIGVADGALIRSAERPYVINLSLLTSRPVVPRIEPPGPPRNSIQSAPH